MSYREVVSRMNGLSTVLTIFISLCLVACVPQSPNSTRKSSKGASSTNTSPTPTTPVFSGNAYWYNGQTINGTLDLADDFSSVIYLRGQAINDYLTQTSGAMSSVFCSVIGFNTNGAKDQFRVRAAPISFNNFQTGQLERLLRLDMNLSSTECQGNVGSLGTLSARAPFYLGSKIFMAVNNGTTGKGIYYANSPAGPFTSRSFGDVKNSSGVALLSNSVNSIFAHNSTVVVGTQSGLGISYDDAATFSAPTLFKNKNISAVGGINAALAVAADNQLYLSGDNGVTFNQFALPVANPTIKEIVGITAGAPYFFIATNLGLFYTTNSGASFTQLVAGSINGIAAGNNRLYVATNSGVQKFNIAGAVPGFMTTLTTANGFASNTINDVAVNATTLYVATTGGLSKGGYDGALFDNTVLTGGEPRFLAAALADAAITMSGGSTLFYQANVTLITPPLLTSTTQLDQVCPTCTSLTSNSIGLYQVVASSIDDNTRVSLLDAALSPLALRISGSGSSGGSGSTCTNGGCQAQGFDCCLDNQCVIDGTERPGASTSLDPQYYAQAKNDVASNLQLFVNYPDVYYVCTQPPVVGGTPTPVPDAQATAAARLQEEYAQYLCLQGAGADPVDYSNCVDSDGDLDSDADDYNLVRLRVWDRCGCEAEPLEEPYCPDYSLSATFDSNGNVQTVSCLIPPPDAMPTPFQNLSINVPARSVPHRFFRSVDGKKVDDISTISNIVPEIVPEGEPFSYLDDSGKTAPVDSPFNINDILGQMSVRLTHALPAKVLKVEFGADYIVSATSGFHTPCPQCARDAWYDSFSPHPTSRDGIGVQAVGYTTRRDLLGSNSSFSNYEDSIFGRACWVPPTMLPFSHMPRGTVMDQRQARLKTQAAMWVNGYQRDWYGFNKGALIGSFDGVKWFAIGGGRRVTSTSESLFLAINAPFGDLTDVTDLSVSVVADLGNNNVAITDYDPTLGLNDSRQNRAGSCQRFHTCEKDIDCISRLGWEYTCAAVDVTDTSWPRFDAVGDEQTGEAAAFGLEDIIFGNSGLQGNNRRCVYRGAGAPCAKDWTTVSADKQEMFRCAPNFYCADIDSNAFNDRVIREPAALQTYQYGQEADVLGRPTNYVLAFNNLDIDIKENLEHNANKMGIAVAELGLCRPGKALADDNLINQHSSEDGAGRTDFINQIASCASDLSGAARTRTCPLINMDTSSATYGDLIYEASGTANIPLRASQNMCGADWKNAGQSVFADVEAEALSSLASLFTPKVAMDACLRRAGSICHTDLDCGPNRLHAEQAIFLDQTSFGNNPAEYKYWTEALVCRQGTNEPSVFADDYEDFDMSLNTCCRELSSGFTMYTNTASAAVDEQLDAAFELNIQTHLLPNGADSAAVTKTYSRYGILDNATTVASSVIPLNTPQAVYPANRSTYNPAGVGTYSNQAFQWKAVNDTGNRTCCGGGWVRKFADGTNDWTNHNRLNLSYTNFSCINYENSMHTTRPANVLPANYNKDRSKLCLNPAEDGCVDKGVQLNSDINNIVTPTDVIATTGILTTFPDESNVQINNGQAYYQPAVYRDAIHTSAAYQFNLIESSFKPRTAFILPIYIGSQANINSVSLTFDGDSMPNPVTRVVSDALVTVCQRYDDIETEAAYADGGSVAANNAQEPGRFCVNDVVAADGQTYTVLFAIANPYVTFSGNAWDFAGVNVSFNVYGTGSHVSAQAGGNGMRAGNANYYETKLARLELLGIPQVFYEPLYCNSERNVLVGGIFDDAIVTRTDFESQSITYTPYTPQGGSARRLEALYDPVPPLYTEDASKTGVGRVVFKDKVKHPDIFSSHEFMCCRQLGNVTESAARCCSNFAAPNSDNELVCMIPSGTDLNVYFNKFVSSEGMGESLPNGGLLEKDFIPETGEPKLTSEVQSKIETLGITFCQNNAVRNGSAMGSFYPQPNSGSFNGDPEAGRTYGIIDSPLDYDPDRDTGTALFNLGYRWTHHIYCQ